MSPGTPATVDAAAVPTAVDAAAVERAAVARFADFSVERFAHFVDCGNKMMATLGLLGPGTHVVHQSYLELCAEAVGASLLGTTSTPTLLAVLLGDVVPQQLVTANNAVGAAHLLARAWNIGEGAQRGPHWIDPYLAVSFRDLALDLNHLADSVVEALERVTTVPVPPSWQAFSTSSLDLSLARADFVPGTMHAVAAGLLCVHDRKHPQSGVVVAVDHGDRSRVIGPSPCLGDASDPEVGGDLPDIDVDDGVALVGGVAVAVPVRRGYWSACLRRGFAVVSAVDSQRLWLLESRPAGPLQGRSGPAGPLQGRSAGGPVGAAVGDAVGDAVESRP